MQDIRTCRTCGQEKSLSECMPKANWCKDCANAYERVRYEVRFGLGQRVIRQPKQPLNILPTEAAYMAGLIDGEGCVGYYRNRSRAERSPMFSVVIANTNPAMRTWIERVVRSGTWKLRSNRGDNSKDCYFVSWYSASAIGLLESVLPYLVLKKPQATWLLGLWRMEEGYLLSRNRCRFSKHCPVPGDIEYQRDVVHTEIHKLNHRGIAA